MLPERVEYLPASQKSKHHHRGTVTSLSSTCSALASIGSSVDLWCTLREAKGGGWVLGAISRILIVMTVTSVCSL